MTTDTTNTGATSQELLAVLQEILGATDDEQEYAAMMKAQALIASQPVAAPGARGVLVHTVDPGIDIIDGVAKLSLTPAFDEPETDGIPHSFWEWMERMSDTPPAKHDSPERLLCDGWLAARAYYMRGQAVAAPVDSVALNLDAQLRSVVRERDSLRAALARQAEAAVPTAKTQDDLEEALMNVLIEQTSLTTDGIDDTVPRMVSAIPARALPYKIVPTEGIDPELYASPAAHPANTGEAPPSLWSGHHPDDAAVRRFAAAMMRKMAASRAKGRSGWDDEQQCPTERLQSMLLDHLAKGDPVDVANFCMMLWNRDAPVAAPSPVGGSAWTLKDASEALKRAQAFPGWTRLPQPVTSEIDTAASILDRVSAVGGSADRTAAPTFPAAKTMSFKSVEDYYAWGSQCYMAAPPFAELSPAAKEKWQREYEASRPAAPLDDDETTRLRRVVRALGMESEVPADDATLRGALFAVLGQIARKLEVSRPAALAAKTVEQQQENTMLEGCISALHAEPAGAYVQPLPMSSAPHDGTEVLAWSITGKTWHQVYWKTQENGDWKFLAPFPPRWACRWNEAYYQGQSEFSYWLPIPAAPDELISASHPQQGERNG